MSQQTPSASKQMVDLETKPETSAEEEKKDQSFGLRTDQYAKKGLQVVTLGMHLWSSCNQRTVQMHWMMIMSV